MTKERSPVVNLNLDRTVYFSDAVIAIAMTLLAIELPVPTGTTSAEVWHSFAHNFEDDYQGFLISFVVIAAFWYQHHRFFQVVARADTRLLMTNLLGLLAIVLVPFATKVLSAQNDFALGPVFYSSVMLLWCVGYVLMVLVADRGGLWREGTPSTARNNMIFGACSALGMFAVSIPIAFASPTLAQLSWMLIPVVAVVSGRLRRRHLAKTARA